MSVTLRRIDGEITPTDTVASSRYVIVSPNSFVSAGMPVTTSCSAVDMDTAPALLPPAAGAASVTLSVTPAGRAWFTLAVIWDATGLLRL